MKILKEFKEFAVKGNAVDMAIGIVVGAAFGTVVKSLVDDIVTPFAGWLIGGVDFGDLTISIGGSAAVRYGLFLNAIFAFVIVSWVLFLIVKVMNKVRAASVDEKPKSRKCQFCFSVVHKKATRCPFCTANIKPE